MKADERAALLRMADANFNRALEGLRVCEEIARMRLNDARVTRRCRDLRHALARSVDALAGMERLRHRDTRRDVGRSAGAYQLRSIGELVLTNAQRAKEAVRVLEEVSRILKPALAAEFQRLRFQLYDAEREILLKLAPLRDPRPRGRARPRSS